MLNQSIAGRSRLGRIALAGVSLVSLLMTGCDDGRLPTAPVRGTVTYNGVPLSTGSVTFLPTVEGGQYASGEIDTTGTFSLSTYEEGDGAIIGAHKVMISAVDAPVDAPAVSIIPDRYGSDQTSGLTAEVQEGDNFVEFVLTSGKTK